MVLKGTWNRPSRCWSALGIEADVPDPSQPRYSGSNDRSPQSPSVSGISDFQGSTPPWEASRCTSFTPLALPAATRAAAHHLDPLVIDHIEPDSDLLREIQAR